MHIKLATEYNEVHVCIILSRILKVPQGMSTTQLLLALGTWMLNELRALYCHGVQEIPAQEDTDDMSGVEVDSPYKFLFESQEFPCDIQGIGEICTSWIGQQGVLEIKRTVSERKTAQEVKTLSSDIKKLASNCYRAFEKAGLLNSEDEVIKGAVELCQTHIQKLPQEGRKRTSAIASLWKQHTSTEAAHCTTDLKKHATAVLGDKLVDTLTEKHREPPDVSLSTCTHTLMSVFSPGPFNTVAPHAFHTTFPKCPTLLFQSTYNT